MRGFVCIIFLLSELTGISNSGTTTFELDSGGTDIGITGIVDPDVTSTVHGDYLHSTDKEELVGSTAIALTTTTTSTTTISTQPITADLKTSTTTISTQPMTTDLITSTTTTSTMPIRIDLTTTSTDEESTDEETTTEEVESTPSSRTISTVE
uniref:Cell wall integrity and stress response component 3-like n=1 Tax=Crassostrea virginica TaxID=6565 RepID=A0A8B8DKB6_CRAVI|nr:cell wall integrity and stress response component 3-like [Crassostrea virginica]